MTTATAAPITSPDHSPAQARADAKLTAVLENTVLSCWQEIDRSNSGQSSRRESITAIRQLADDLSNQARVISHVLEGSR